MIKVLFLIVDRDLEEKEYLNLLQAASLEKQDKIKKFRYFADRQRSLLGDVLVKTLIQEKTNLDIDEIFFATNVYGKPFCVNVPQLQFNISHAGRYVTCAVDEHPIGIDVELIKPIDFKIVKRFFSDDEKAYIFTQPEEKRLLCFYQIWTMKESYIKYDGRGLNIPLQSFSVLSPSRTDIVFHQIFSNHEAICNVCTTQQNKPDYEILTIKDIIYKQNIKISDKELNCNGWSSFYF